jgi:hypothetical protein
MSYSPDSSNAGRGLRGVPMFPTSSATIVTRYTCQNSASLTAVNRPGSAAIEKSP